jgi:hypothetical protein
MTGVFFWMVEQLRASASCTQRRTLPNNPNPPGTIHDGSTTDAVLEVLGRYTPRYLSYSQIVDFTGRSPKAVSWSLCYLKELGRIEARQADDPRSPLYKMYRLKGE